MYKRQFQDNIIKSLNDGLFMNCNISSIQIPTSVENIGQNVFKGCKHINNVVFPRSVNYIGPNVFNGCDAIDNITITGKLYDYINNQIKLSIYKPPPYNRVYDNIWDFFGRSDNQFTINFDNIFSGDLSFSNQIRQNCFVSPKIDNIVVVDISKTDLSYSEIKWMGKYEGVSNESYNSSSCLLYTSPSPRD